MTNVSHFFFSFCCFETIADEVFHLLHTPLPSSFISIFSLTLNRSLQTTKSSETSLRLINNYTRVQKSSYLNWLSLHHPTEKWEFLSKDSLARFSLCDTKCFHVNWNGKLIHDVVTFTDVGRSQVQDNSEKSRKNLLNKRAMNINQSLLRSTSDRARERGKEIIRRVISSL